jgi:DNA repair exonuclease SbcCD ATPase subunit
MPHAKYRLSEITIEGFRGFTSPQTIPVKKKNVFIFGQNGHGKSSIVEAIRWCLFGSGSSDIEVRNTFYTKQECRVSLLLEGQSGSLRINRELRGGSNRSRRTVIDSSGKEVSVEEALPLLTRLGSHESTQIIFAAQHAAGRQLMACTRFRRHRVRCFYGTGGESWKDEGLHASSSLRLCG